MSAKPAIAALARIATQPLQKQLDFLVEPFTTGQVLQAPWDPDPGPPVWTQGLAQAYLQRLVIEQTAKLASETSRLTKWLIGFTGVLVALTIMLVLISLGIIPSFTTGSRPHP